MSNLVDISLLDEKVGDYKAGTSIALKDHSILPAVRYRRRQIGQMMVPLDIETAKRKVPPGDYFISRKIDGEFTCLVYKDGEVITVNPGGTVRAGAAFHEEAGALLKKAGVKSAIIGGELYVKRDDGKRPRVHDVTRVARAPKTQAEVDSLHFAVFNIYELDDKEQSIALGALSEKINELFDGGERVHPVETTTGDQKQVLKYFKDWVEGESEEGLVIYNESAGYFKIKPRHSLDLAVVGFSESIDDRAGMLHSLLMAILRPDGGFHIVGRVGGGFSDEQRVSILEELEKEVVESNYAEVNSHRVAYKMLRPGRVIEISCLDVISQTSTGGPIERMLLDWNEDDQCWEGVRRLPICSIVSPQFVRFRDDKDANAEDVRISQLEAITEIPDLGKSLEDLQLPKAEILQRSVATKELKGKKMVRKLIMWKTNKDQVSDDYPAYVLHLTNYSPNKKTPLEREVRVSNSKEQIEQFWADWEKKYFVKGWAVQEAS